MEAVTVEVAIQTTVHSTHAGPLDYAGLHMEHRTVLLRATMFHDSHYGRVVNANASIRSSIFT